MSSQGWIGIDFDATLAYWGGAYPQDVMTAGPPIPAMVATVKAMLAAGADVRIFTARVGPATDPECEAFGMTAAEFIWHQRELIEQWCELHLGALLRVTATKDFHMRELWDDRARQVVSNTGLPAVSGDGCWLDADMLAVACARHGHPIGDCVVQKSAPITELIRRAVKAELQREAANAVEHVDGVR